MEISIKPHNPYLDCKVRYPVAWTYEKSLDYSPIDSYVGEYEYPYGWVNFSSDVGATANNPDWAAFFPIIVPPDTVSTEPELGIEQRSISTELSVYPNPAQHFFQIASSDDIRHVELYDVQGKKIREWKTTMDKYEVSGISAGSYRLHITTRQGRVVIRQLIIN